MAKDLKFLLGQRSSPELQKLCKLLKITITTEYKPQLINLIIRNGSFGKIRILLLLKLYEGKKFAIVCGFFVLVTVLSIYGHLHTISDISKDAVAYAEHAPFFHNTNISYDERATVSQNNDRDIQKKLELAAKLAPREVQRAITFLDNDTTLQEGINALYDAQVGLEPKERAQAYLWISSGELKRNNISGALESLETAVRLDNETPLYHYLLANAYASIGRVNDALTEYNKTISIIPNESTVHNDKANLLAKIGEYSNAIKEMSIAIALDNSSDHWNNLGIIYAEYGLATREVSLLNLSKNAHRTAIEIDSSSPRSYYLLGMTYRDLGLSNESLYAYDTAIEKINETGRDKNLEADLWNNRATALGHLYRYDESLTAINKALNITPNNFRYLSKKATIYCEMGKYIESKQFYDMSIAENPLQAQTWNNYGLFLYKIGQCEDSLLAINKSLLLDENYELARENYKFIAEICYNERALRQRIWAIELERIKEPDNFYLLDEKADLFLSLKDYQATISIDKEILSSYNCAIPTLRRELALAVILKEVTVANGINAQINRCIVAQANTE